MDKLVLIRHLRIEHLVNSVQYSKSAFLQPGGPLSGGGNQHICLQLGGSRYAEGSNVHVMLLVLVFHLKFWCKTLRYFHWPWQERMYRD